MIPTGDDIHPRRKYFFRRLDSDSRAARGIFSIGDDKIQGMPLAQFGKQFPHRASPRLPNNVTNEQKFHAIQSSRSK